MPPRPPLDHAGPHPANQRKRRELQGPRQSLIGLLSVAAVLSVAGGFALIARPDGHLLRLSLDLRVDSPFTSFRTTGVVLAVVIGGSQAIAALLLVRHTVRARRVALIAALIAVAWGVLQLTMLAELIWFSIALFGLGALEVLLVAACTPRNSPALRSDLTYDSSDL